MRLTVIMLVTERSIPIAPDEIASVLRMGCLLSSVGPVRASVTAAKPNAATTPVYIRVLIVSRTKSLICKTLLTIVKNTIRSSPPLDLTNSAPGSAIGVWDAKAGEGSDSDVENGMMIGGSVEGAGSVKEETARVSPGTLTVGEPLRDPLVREVSS